MSQFNVGGGTFGNTGQGGSDSEAVSQLNSLLRGEISACETYRQTIDKVEDSDQIAMDNLSILRDIEEEHESACDMIRNRIVELGGQPSDSSGAWGTWATTVQGTMNLFGDTSALKGLKEGEEHGLKDYEEALDDVDSQSRQMIAEELIPSQQRHISLLNQLINVTGKS